MKSKLLAVTATVLGGFLSSAFADTTIEAAPARIEVPAPIEVVKPMRLSYAYEGMTFDVSFTVDATGKTHDIRILSKHDDNLRKSLVTAMKQWKFKPATKNGTPISTKVIMPVQLI